jgi:hypothetical protein
MLLIKRDQLRECASASTSATPWFAGAANYSSKQPVIKGVNFRELVLKGDAPAKRDLAGDRFAIHIAGKIASGFVIMRVDALHNGLNDLRRIVFPRLQGSLVVALQVHRRSPSFWGPVGSACGKPSAVHIGSSPAVAGPFERFIAAVGMVCRSPAAHRTVTTSLEGSATPRCKRPISADRDRAGASDDAMSDDKSFSLRTAFGSMFAWLLCGTERPEFQKP